MGGCTTTLLITDKAAANVRPTFDVDAIAEITSYTDYVAFSAKLRELGFAEDTSEDALICRWRQATTLLDVMPLDEKILGFSNRWYKSAMDSAQERDLEPDLRIRIVTAVYFCATKLDAFHGRGQSDFLASHDLEDLIAVIDGRPELASEVRAACEDVRVYIASGIGRLLNTPTFVDALPGYLLPDHVSQARITLLLERLIALAAL